MARPKKKAPAQDNIPESIFDALNQNSPGGAGEGKPSPQASEPTVAELMEQLKGLQTRIDSTERANLALSTASPTVVQEPKEPTFSLDGLPDPIDDAKGYAAELASRQAKYQGELQNFYTQKQNNTAAQTDNAGALWDDFKEQFGDYAEDMEGVEFATLKARNAAQRRGLDLNKYMYQNSDRFFRDVIKHYDARFGKPGEEEDDVDVAPAPRRKAKRMSDQDEDDGRTSGVFGGLDASGGNRVPKAPPVGDMIKDLQDVQRKTGYY